MPKIFINDNEIFCLPDCRSDLYVVLFTNNNNYYYFLDFEKKCTDRDGNQAYCPTEWAVNHSILQIVFACFVIANGIDGVRIIMALYIRSYSIESDNQY